MSRKKIFILTTSFLLLVLLVAFIRYRIQDSPEAAIADDYNGYENQDNQPEPQENEAEPDTAYVPPIPAHMMTHTVRMPRPPIIAP